jgi:hypothetical protein
MSKNIGLYAANVIKCPNCDGIHLHQGKITAYCREREDHTVGTVLIIEKDLASHEPSDMSENPSPRRNGMTIDFDCEECDAEPRLAIYQHMGCTYVQWESMRQKIQD